MKRQISNLEKCDFVGISEQLERSVRLANSIFDWNLSTPKRINVARSKKAISQKLRNMIIRDNHLDQKLYQAAMSRFNELCKTHDIFKR